MRKVSRRRALWFCLGRPLICLAGLAATSNSVRAIESPHIERFKSTWRAQDGETIEQIISNVSKVAQFVPRMWGVAELDENDYIFVSWTRHPDDTLDEQYVITWRIALDGTFQLASTYAKPIELGWHALALSLIATEVKEGERDANLRFLHDPSNFNFVTTTQGRLGDLLRQGRCTIVEPVGVDYLPKQKDKPTEKGDLWRVLLLVNCNIPGPRFLHTTGSSLSRRAKGKIGSRNPPLPSVSQPFLPAPGSLAWSQRNGKS